MVGRLAGYGLEFAVSLQSPRPLYPLRFLLQQTCSFPQTRSKSSPGTHLHTLVEGRRGRGQDRESLSCEAAGIRPRGLPSHLSGDPFCPLAKGPIRAILDLAGEAERHNDA